jgi:hypothetical protein
MKDAKQCSEGARFHGGEDTHSNKKKGAKDSAPADSSRRSFLSTAGGATAAVLAIGIPLEPMLEGRHGQAEAAITAYNSPDRANASYQYRKGTAQDDKINVGQLPDNGDAQRFTDFSGNWSKALKHDALGVPNAASWKSLVYALTTGRFQDFENIIVGTPGGTGFTSTLNGPQGALAFDIEGLDSHATKGIPAAPSVASAQTASEQVEHYWGALLRDIHFTDYPTNSLVAQAVSDMNNLSFVKSSADMDIPYPVTPQNLFRGQIVPGDGNVQGPYLSQFLLQPTFFGAQPLSQQYQRFLSVSEGGADYLTSVGEYQDVQNGIPPNRQLTLDPTFRFLRQGRDLAAYTHVDVLHQSYFVALLVLAGLNAPMNPGNPYNNSLTQHGFGTLGGPDAAGTISEMATRALKASWFHKWIVNLRMRPEEYGALVQARLTNSHPFPQAAGALHSDVLNSAVLPIVYSQYGSYLLPQAYPEASPAHPCYPAGHGTVAGACITALKFFFDGTQKIRPLLQAAGADVYVPSSDGLSLVPYTGSDRDSLDINGELVKLGSNITFGHGIHAGIHFRSSSMQALLLGEQVGLSILQDRAKCYNEPFTIKIKKFDGTIATISNQ